MNEKPLTSLTLEEINSEIDHIVNFVGNGGGYGAPEAKEADDRKLQILMQLRAEKLSTVQEVNEPDLSAVRHLIPLTEVKHFDPELWERCRIPLSSAGNDPKTWDNAVRMATVVLEERLRKLGKIDTIDTNATGANIVNLIFAPKKSILSGKLKANELQAYRDLYSGVMSVFRNPYGHRIIDPDPEVGGAILVFIDLLLKMLDNIDWDRNEGSV